MGKKFYKYLFLSVVIISSLLLAHNYFDPPDWVDLHLTKIPPEVDEIYVVARDQRGTFPLNWYFAKIQVMLADSKRGQHWHLDVSGDRRRGDIQWKSANAYGILARRKSGEWVLWWLNSRDIKGPSFSRYIIGGGAKVEIQAFGIESATKAPKSLLDQVKTD